MSRTVSAQPFTTDARIEFLQRLSTEWNELRITLDIPDAQARRFPRGHEASEIWSWLSDRHRLRDLPGALRRIERSDLADALESSAAEPTRTDVVIPARFSVARVSQSRMWLVIGSVTGCITLAVGGVFTYMLTAHNTVAHGSCTRSVFSCEWIPTSVAALWQSYPFQSPRQEEIGRDIIAVTPDYVGCARSDGVLATRVSFMPKEVGEIGGIGLHSVDRSKPFVDLSAKSAITVVARGERGHETFGIDVLTSESGHYRARVQNSTALRVNEWTTIVVPFSAFVGDDDGRPLETDKRRAVRNLAVGWGGGDAAEDLCIDRLSVD